MDLSLETLSRDFSDGQLADNDSCIVRSNPFLFLISLYLSFLFSCSEVEQSCDASLVRGGCIRDVSNKISLCISLVYVLLFLGVDASKCEHLHCRALGNTRRLNKKTADGHA